MSNAQTGAVAAASIAGALSNFVILFFALRAISVEDGAEFLVYWSLLFGMFGVVVGVQHETTRTLGSALADPARARARFLPAALIVGAMVAAAILLLSPLISTSLLPASSALAIPLLLAATLAQTVHVALVGSLAGQGRWFGYAGLLTGEVALRMAVILLVALLLPSLSGFELAAASGVLISGVALLAVRSTRNTITTPGDAELPRQTRNYLLAVLSTASTALLITGYPALVQATNPNADSALLAALILAVSLTRAPIMMPLTTFQGVAVKAFLAAKDAPLRAIARPVGYLTALGAVGAVAAWPIGPWFIALFRAEYVLPGWVFAALTFESALMAVLTILGTLALALDAHRIFAIGWLLASAVAIAVLMAGLPLTNAILISLAAGPLAGCAVFLWWLLTVVRRKQLAG